MRGPPYTDAHTPTHAWNGTMKRNSGGELGNRRPAGTVRPGTVRVWSRPRRLRTWSAPAVSPGALWRARPSAPTAAGVLGDEGGRGGGDREDAVGVRCRADDRTGAGAQAGCVAALRSGRALGGSVPYVCRAGLARSVAAAERRVPPPEVRTGLRQAPSAVSGPGDGVRSGGILAVVRGRHTTTVNSRTLTVYESRPKARNGLGGSPLNQEPLTAGHSRSRSTSLQTMTFC